MTSTYPTPPVANAGGTWSERVHAVARLLAEHEHEIVPQSTCQHCLAGPGVPVAFHLPMEKRCPVCGAAYTGPRRSLEYRLLLEAGLVAKGGD